MAEGQDENDKSEDPTQKRLDDALKRGDVAKSQEVNTWFVIAGGTLVMMAFAGSMSHGLTTSMRGLLANSYAIRVEGRGFLPVVQKIGIEVIAAVAIPMLLLVLAAIAGNMVQHRLVWSGEPLKPKFSKISPLAGFKRLFSKQALMNFVKGLVKLALLGAVMTALLWPERTRLDTVVMLDPAAILPMTQTLSLQLLGAVVAIMALIAAADFLFQYKQWFDRQKMSFQELKDEYKNTEGDPHREGQDPADPRGPDAQAHDGGGAGCHGRHHQPDPLRRRPEIRARHERPDLRRQGHGRDRAQDPRGRRPRTRCRSWRTRRSPARCTPPSRSTAKSPPSTTRRWRKSSATS